MGIGRGKGFTLLEFVVILVILGILATLSLVQYQAFVERSRTSEAKTVLMQIRTAYNNYNLEHRSNATSINDLDLNEEIPEASCDRHHYFRYSLHTAYAEASRCTSGGKLPNVRSANSYVIRIDFVDGNWSGTQGYY